MQNDADSGNERQSVPPRGRQRVCDVLAAKNPKDAGSDAEYQGRSEARVMFELVLGLAIAVLDLSSLVLMILSYL